MRYGQYITKKRMRVKGLCGPVNLPYGTVLPAEGDFILLDGRRLCAVTSQNAKDHFWGYDPRDPEGEISRQEAAAQLMALAPPGTGDELAKEDNPWRRYGRLEEIPGAWMWRWDESVADYPKFLLDELLRKVRGGQEAKHGTLHR